MTAILLDFHPPSQYNACMKLQGKVAVITGASMGIGEAMAQLFFNEGAKVVLCSRDLARTQAAQERIGGGAAALDGAVAPSEAAQRSRAREGAGTRFCRIAYVRKKR